MTDPSPSDGGAVAAGSATRAPTARPRVHPVVDRLGATSWRLVGMGLVFVAGVWVLARLWVILLAVAIAVLFSRALNPAAVMLRRLGMRPALVAALVMLGFAAVMAGIIAALVPAIAAEFEELGPTVEQSIDDVEDWLVEDSPFDISRGDIEDFRNQLDERVSEYFSQSSDSVVSGTLVAVEVVTALILSLITTFFILKDGERFGRWLLGYLPDGHHGLATRLARKAWWTIGGYLRGAAILGVVEGTIIGITVWLAGGTLAVPVAVITFFAAFIPFAGAIVAGALAVLVTLVTGGPGGAIVVLVVAVLLQQLDNDLLAPMIYGKGLELHPLVVLFALAGGSALMGPAGALFAVPASAVVINVMSEARQHHLEKNVSPATRVEPAPAGTGALPHGGPSTGTDPGARPPDAG